MSKTIIWTFEKVKEEALKYKTRKEFRLNSPKAYDAAVRNKWIEELCKHMIRLHKPNNYWTFEKVKEEALKHKTKGEFEKNASGAYDVALKNEWINKICSHMISSQKPTSYWTFEKVKEEALKHNSRTEFCEKSGSAYNKAALNNWLDIICKHMKTFGDYYKRLIYVFEFSDNYAYIGLTCDIERRIEEHKREKKSQVYKHKLKTNLEPKCIILTDYINVKLAQKLEEYWKNHYKENGWIILNIAKTGSIGGVILNNI